MNQPLYLVITIDVEEEGLFSGKYPREGAGVANVAELRRLEFIPREFGFPLTLLATYPVAQDPDARQTLLTWHREHQAEIGAHLHPWNTPPFAALPEPEPIPTARLPLSLVADKLGTLVNCLSENFPEPPRAFRMGRFDWSPGLLDMLPRFGLTVDTSMVPLTIKGPGLPNFLAPADPFWLPSSHPETPPPLGERGLGEGGEHGQHPGIDQKIATHTLVLPHQGEGSKSLSGWKLTNPASPGGGLLEAPVTMVSVWAPSARAVVGLAGLLPANLGHALLSRYRFVGAAGVHPPWFPLFSMRLAARLHRRRGGRVLTLFLHSSELLPGGSPDFPDEAAVSHMVSKLRAFLTWLVNQGPVLGVTLSGLHDLLE